MDPYLMLCQSTLPKKAWKVLENYRCGISNCLTTTSIQLTLTNVVVFSLGSAANKMICSNTNVQRLWETWKRIAWSFGFIHIAQCSEKWKNFNFNNEKLGCHIVFIWYWKSIYIDKETQIFSSKEIFGIFF